MAIEVVVHGQIVGQRALILWHKKHSHIELGSIQDEALIAFGPRSDTTGSRVCFRVYLVASASSHNCSRIHLVVRAFLRFVPLRVRSLNVQQADIVSDKSLEFCIVSDHQYPDWWQVLFVLNLLPDEHFQQRFAVSALRLLWHAAHYYWLAGRVVEHVIARLRPRQLLHLRHLTHELKVDISVKPVVVDRAIISGPMVLLQLLGNLDQDLVPQD